MNIYATGDDIAIGFTIMKNGQPLTGGLAGATVTVAMRTTDRTAVATGTGDVTATITDATACTCTAIWPRATTTNIEPGRYIVDAQVTIGGQVITYPGGIIEIIDGSRPA